MIRSWLLFVCGGGAALLSISGCSNSTNSNQTANTTPVLIEFEMNDSTTTEFIGAFDGNLWSVFNGAEEISMQPVNDTVWRVPVFGGSWVLKEGSGVEDYEGYWVDSLRASNGSVYTVPLTISVGSKPKNQTNDRTALPDGTWDVWFGKRTDVIADAQLDVAYKNDRLQATMRTPTGDYRYLTGTCINQKLRLQTYDGAHLFLFTASYVNGNWVGGQFFSGNHYQTTWSATRSDPTAGENPMQVFAVSNQDLTASFINREGKVDTLSLLSDSLIVLDVLGTWCPNCMDEVRLLAGVHRQGARFISIAFERDTLAAAAYQRLDGFASEMNMDWEVYLGGRASKGIAADAFPFLDRVLSFPTTLFIQNNTVVVHSGFNGPATGERYELERERFNNQLKGVTSLESH